MKFSELNPMMGASMHPGVNELAFNCPLCGNRMSIYCHAGPPDESRAIWHWEHAVTQDASGKQDYSWDNVTIDPSIATHHVKRGQPRCQVHLRVTKGEVTP